MFSSEQSPQSLVRRIRALADKRQKEAAKERRSVAQGLLGAAHGYRALADALERQPALPWLQSAGRTAAPVRADDAEPDDAGQPQHSARRA